MFHPHRQVFFVVRVVVPCCVVVVVIVGPSMSWGEKTFFSSSLCSLRLSVAPASITRPQKPVQIFSFHLCVFSFSMFSLLAPFEFNSICTASKYP